MLILSAKVRKTFGRKVKTLRKKGVLPAVLYGPKTKGQNLEIDAKEFAKVYQQAGESSLISLEIRGEREKNPVLIHEVAFDPVSDKPVHVDLYQPSLTEEIEAKVPLQFVGDSLAVKDLGGTLVKSIHEIGVKALPQNLPHELKVSVEKLKTFADNLLIKDIVLPQGVTLLKGPEEVVASVVAPKEVEEELAKPVEVKPEEVEKVGQKKEKVEEPEESTEGEAQADPLAERQKLEEELAKLEAEIAQYEGQIAQTQEEKKTLQNKIYILRSQIEKINLQIEHNNIMIKDLGIQLEDTKASISKTASKIDESRRKLVDILRLIYEKDQQTMVEVLLSEDKLSDFFSNLVALEALCVKNQELLDNIKQLKGSLENQEQSLDSEKKDLENLLRIQILQKQESQTVKQGQEWLLEKTKGQESEYQKLLSERQQKAAEIRSRIFELIGVEEAPTFGEALALAKEVEAISGVRPAFLLAVMTQESNIGKNVGQCYLPQDPVENRSKRIMACGAPASKRDDVSLFLQICQELGRDPYNTPVSCPMSYGWGGAMGPAQFIPTTWADPYSSLTKVSYKDRVKEISAKATADPWDIRDAFLAAALYLGDYGAKKQTADDEWRAAMIYFSGSTNRKYRFYGDSVLRIAEQYTSDIAELEGV